MPLHQRSFIAPGAKLSLSEEAMQRRAASQMPSLSKPAANIPTSVAATTVFLPASATQAPATAEPPPAPVSTVIITTSVLAPNPPTTPSSPPVIIPTSVTTVITQVQVLTTVPTATPGSGFTTTPRGTDSGTSAILTNIAGTTGAVYGPPRSSSGSSLSRSSSAARASASSFHSSTPSPHKPKSNVGKYVGYAIGAVFFLTLISSFYSAYRKHRKYVRKRPRGSIFIGGALSAGQSSPQKRSMAQALMRSVSNSSFDAYALSSTPPASPSPVFLNGSQQIHTRGFSPSPLPIRPLPPTPLMKYAHEDDSVFFPHAVDAHEYSGFGVSSSGSSTQTTSMK